MKLKITKGGLISAFAKVAGAGVFGVALVGVYAVAATSLVAGPAGIPGGLCIGLVGGSVGVQAATAVHNKIKFG